MTKIDAALADVSGKVLGAVTGGVFGVLMIVYDESFDNYLRGIDVNNWVEGSE
ncbi:MAG: hypothetical protein WCO00_07930 [Rhodospirillaceae bacterium]